MLQIPVYMYICGKFILAIVDTAAEVTIISDQVFETLGNKPKISKKVIMHAVGREMQRNGVRLVPIELDIGKKTYSESMYVAPIEDDMLLGLDFLLKHQANVNLGSQRLEIGNEKLSLRVGKNNSVRVKRITVNKKTVVPAFSVLRMPCQMDSELQSD
jgi:predicted aspartyl protease